MLTIDEIRSLPDDARMQVLASLRDQIKRARADHDRIKREAESYHAQSMDAELRADERWAEAERIADLIAEADERPC